MLAESLIRDSPPRQGSETRSQGAPIIGMHNRESRCLRFAAIRIEEQSPIAGSHHAESEAHQANRPITQIVAFPPALGHVVETEENASDFAVACSILPSVKGAKGKEETVSTSVGQRGRIGTRVAAGQAAPELDRGVCTDLEELVERQEYGGRL